MRIAEIERFPLKMSANGSENGTEVRLSKSVDIDTVIIKITTDAQVVGFGEVSVASAPNQSIGGLLDWLEIYAKALTGVDALNLAAVNRQLDKVRTNISTECRPARAAFDMAIYDIIGKARGVPAHEILGGAYRTEMEMSATLDEGTFEQIAADACRLVEQGFRGLKVNIGNSLDSNEPNSNNYELAKQKLLVVLDAVGPEITVNADASQSWTNAGQVRSIFASLLDEKYYHNLSLEQPLHHLDLSGHAELRRSLPIPIAVGDGVTSPQSMVQISRTAAADSIALNINTAGGIRSARQIADICEASAIGVSVRTKTGSRLADAAHCQLAATIRDPLPFNVGDHHGFDKSVFSGGYEICDGSIVLSNEPGLGVHVNEQALLDLALEI